MSENTAPRRPFVLRDKEDGSLDSLRLDLSEDTPRVYMKVCNVTDDPIVYKVKTTEPRRYIVRPNQNPLGPQGFETIEISLLKKEKHELLKTAYNRNGVLAGGKDQLDRFLVQSMPIDRNFYEALESMKPQEKSDALTQKWQDFSAEPQRKYIKKQKLDMHFTFAPEGGADGAAGSQDPAAVADKVREAVAAGAGDGADRPAEGVDHFEEMRRLRRQYDELVDFSVRLTAEREVLQKHLESTKTQWMREMKARVALENQLGTGGRSRAGSGDGDVGDARDGDMAAPAASGFTLVQLAVIAVVFFFVGRLLSG